MKITIFDLADLILLNMDRFEKDLLYDSTQVFVSTPFNINSDYVFYISHMPRVEITHQNKKVICSSSLSFFICKEKKESAPPIGSFWIGKDFNQITDENKIDITYRLIKNLKKSFKHIVGKKIKDAQLIDFLYFEIQKFLIEMI